MEKSYFITIPAEIRVDKKLTPLQKLLYGEVLTLSQKSGYCYASNQYFSGIFGIHERNISKNISEMVKKKYLKSEVKGKNRKIFLPKRRTQTTRDATRKQLHNKKENKYKYICGYGHEHPLGTPCECHKKYKASEMAFQNYLRGLGFEIESAKDITEHMQDIFLHNYHEEKKKWGISPHYDTLIKRKRPYRGLGK